MKFVYVDETGSDNSVIFVMLGIMIDAYKFRKASAEIDAIFERIRSLHQSEPRDIKCTKLINGKGGWKKIPLDERKKFLRNLCLKLADVGDLYVIAIAIEEFNRAKSEYPELPSKQNECWHASAMFLVCSIQKKMQEMKNNKGTTVLIVDDNKMKMPYFSDCIFNEDPYCDDLYSKEVGKKKHWKTPGKGFDQIIDTGFSVKSDHSSLILMADCLAYIYRRHFELKKCPQKENWPDERKFIEECFEILEPRRKRLGRTKPDSQVVGFYKSIVVDGWKI